MTKKIVILISGNGSNLQAFIDAEKKEGYIGKIAGVISNKQNAPGLIRANDAGIPTQVIDHCHFASRELFDLALADGINQFKPDLVILAGFMRILTKQFVTKFRGRLLNIHPSLLPKYPGLHTHQRAIENNELFHGTSVHFVTEELDGGPVISQAKTAIRSNDTEKKLFVRIQSLEHRLYPETVQLLLNNKIELIKDDIYFENKKLEKAITF